MESSVIWPVAEETEDLSSTEESILRAVCSPHGDQTTDVSGMLDVTS